MNQHDQAEKTLSTVRKHLLDFRNTEDRTHYLIGWLKDCELIDLGIYTSKSMAQVIDGRTSVVIGEYVGRYDRAIRYFNKCVNTEYSGYEQLRPMWETYLNYYPHYKKRIAIQRLKEAAATHPRFGCTTWPVNWKPIQEAQDGEHALLVGNNMGHGAVRIAKFKNVDGELRAFFDGVGWGVDELQQIGYEFCCPIVPFVDWTQDTGCELTAHESMMLWDE